MRLLVILLVLLTTCGAPRGGHQLLDLQLDYDAGPPDPCLGPEGLVCPDAGAPDLQQHRPPCHPVSLLDDLGAVDLGTCW